VCGSVGVWLGVSVCVRVCVCGVVGVGMCVHIRSCIVDDEMGKLCHG
jgi:hypothetical protein